MNKLSSDPRLPLAPDGYQKQLNARLYEIIRHLITNQNALIDGNTLNVTSAQKAVLPATAGLRVFDTTLGKLCVYNGSAWETITSV
jgi:hypothetical protein